MPIKGAKYRVTTRGGKKIRLAFVGGRVVEAKNLQTGAVHTPQEFKRDRTRRRKKKNG